MKNAIPAAALCLVLASSVFAQNDDAETRFHRAYEQEVVEGRTADAARVYLAMMDDAQVPARLRQEAKFRFAVTATLLGRADEARAHFAELSRDASAPESLRARAAEYLDATKSIGVGTELEKKLQALVFDLAKTPSDDFNAPDWGNPPAYRDFEVIGKRAVPFLRQMLAHDDVALRKHAFRILLRLRDPGLMDRWTPKIQSAESIVSGNEIEDYLEALPDELAVFEKKVLALSDDALRNEMHVNFLAPRVSVEFLRAAAKRDPAGAVRWVHADADEAHARLLVEWVESDDDALSEAAVVEFLEHAPPAWASPAELLPIVAKRLAAAPRNWNFNAWPDGDHDLEGDRFRNLKTLAKAAPVSVVLDAIQTNLDAREAAKTDPDRWSGQLDALCLVVDAAAPAGDDVVRYAALLRRRWAREIDGAKPDVAAGHANSVLARLPVHEAAEFAAWLFGRSAEFDPAWADALPLTDAQRVPVVLAAYRAGSPKAKAVVANESGLAWFEARGLRVDDAAFAHAILAAMPDFVHESAALDDATPPVGPFAYYARRVPVEEARDRLVAVARAVAEWRNDGPRLAAIERLLTRHDGDATTTYWSDVVLPAADQVWLSTRKTDHDAVFKAVFDMPRAAPRDATLAPLVAHFAFTHIEEAPHDAVYFMAGHPELFPPAAWVPRTAAAKFNFTDVAPKDVADAAAREMTKDPSALTEGALDYAATEASAEARREIFDRLLRAAPVDRLRVVLPWLKNAGPDAMQEALSRTMTGERPDIEVVRVLAFRLAKDQPSEALFPAVRLLLAQTVYDAVSTGISAAKSLGREELLPDLAKALDSLQPEVRQEAKEAIDSIVALRKLKEETRKDAAGK